MLAPNLNTPVHISGDEDRGLSTTFDLRSNALAQALLIYTGRHAHPFPEKELRCEIYDRGNDVIQVHTLCVRCGKGLMVSSDRKDIRWEHKDGEPFAQLWIEPFECTHELEDRRMEFGLNLCRARVAYDGRVIKDA